MSEVWDLFERRLTTLEERTRPKPRTVLDRIKDWSGVATACIALLYTIPLGVWDRFVTSHAQVQERRVAELRTAVLQLSDIDAQTARSFSTIGDPQLRAFFGRAMGTQRAAILSRNEPVITDPALRRGLSHLEQAILAYHVGQFGRVQLAEQIYDEVLEGLVQSQSATTFVADVFRMQAQLALMAPAGVDIARIRQRYSRNIEMLLRFQTPGLILQAANSMVEWAAFERDFGDFACARTLGLAARGTLDRLPNGPEASALSETLAAQLDAAQVRPGQASLGCPAEVVSLFRNVDLARQ
jgi:hypothetical protein